MEKKSQMKLAMLCRSLKGSDISEEHEDGKRSIERLETRERRIKEIVEVPVYITKEIIKEVDRPIIK